MKIAVISDNGKSVSKHFGKAVYYSIFTIEDGKVVSNELRDRKFRHNQHMENQTQHEHVEGEPHGIGQNDRHDSMAGEIGDCQVLIAGGMGRGAYVRMFENGINVIMTDENDVETAIQKYLNNELKNLYEDLTH